MIVCFIVLGGIIGFEPTRAALIDALLRSLLPDDIQGGCFNLQPVLLSCLPIVDLFNQKSPSSTNSAIFPEFNKIQCISQ